MEPTKGNSLNKSCGDVISSNCIYKVYSLVDPITNYIRYIGYTSYSLEKRLEEHITIDCRYYKGNWIKGLLKQGQRPIIKQIEETTDISIAKSREIYYIGFWGREDLKRGLLTNLTDGGTGGRGGKRSKEFKENIREQRIGTKNPFYGKKHSEETKKRIAVTSSGVNNGFYGKKHTEETVERIKIKCRTLIPWNKGIPMTQEQKEKISNTKKRKNGTYKI